MKKITINGDLLRKAISNKSLTILNAARIGKIAEKTLHRLLNGEPIKESKVVMFFKNMELNHLDYLEDSFNANKKDNGESFVRSNMQGSNNEITLVPFEMPHSHEIPSFIIWDFDITNPSDELLELFKKFNKNMEDYCNKENINVLSFDGSFARLSLTSSTHKIVKEISQHDVFVFSGMYKFFSTSEEFCMDGTDDKIKHYNSSMYLYLYITQNSFLTHVIAKVNGGKYPPIKKEEKYKYVLVDGRYDFYPDQLPF